MLKRRTSLGNICEHRGCRADSHQGADGCCLRLLLYYSCSPCRSSYIGRWGNPLFSVHDNLSPVVTLEQNFDR